MKKNKVITIVILFAMIFITAFVLMKTNLISKVFKLKADTNQIVLQENEAMFKTGETLNRRMKLLASGKYTSISTEDQIVTRIQRTNSLNIAPTEDNVVSIDSGKPIYMWFDNGTIYYYTEATKIYLNPNSSSLFSYMSAVTDIDIDDLDTSKVTNMSYMFSHCSALTDLNISSFNTGNVTDMSAMFSHCSALTSLNLSSFNTSNVTDMKSMFSNCIALTSLNLSNFNTSKVTNMSYMFGYCIELLTLNISSFDTSNVINMQGMFDFCKNITSLDVSNFNTSKITDMSYMFSECESLTSLNLSNFNTSNVIDMSSMFDNCKTLTSITFGSNFDTSKVTNMKYIFCGCSSLTSLNLSNFNTSNVINMYGMFYRCKSLTNIDVSHFNTSNVISMGAMFYDCNALTNLNISNFNTSNVTNMSYMFEGCISLTNIDVSHFNTSSVTDMRGMFESCIALTSLDVSNFNTSNVIYMSSMFSRCKSLTSLDVSNFNTSNVIYMSSMFSRCTYLTNLDLSNFNTSNVTSMSYMFEDCESLTSLNLSSFDTSKVTNMSYMFYNCSALTSLNLNSFDTSKATNMSSMFEYCTSLTNLNLSSFNTSNVTDMSYMFYDCNALTNLNLSNFNTSNVIYMNNMFSRCKSLTILDLSSFGTSNVTSMKSMFYDCSALITIYVSSKFKTISIVEDSDISYIFFNCEKLTGQNGTKYSSSNDYKTYARIDTEGSPGYFSQITYNILYDGNGASEGMMPIDVHAYQEEKALLKNIFVKVGYIFTGWNTKIDGSGTSYRDEQNVINLTNENGKIITLYAQWIKGTYKLTFDANGGTVSVPSMDVTYGETYTNLPTPTKAGYAFKGWYYDLTKENDYINYGRDYMYTNKLSVHVSVYMDNWSNYGNAISSTQYGGFNIESKEGYIRYASYDSGIGYKQASSTVLWSSLESGWHDFDLVFDGDYVYGYLDGEKIATSEKYESGKIGYNASNSIFVGAEADISATTPYSSDFNGYVGNVVIKNESNLTLSSTYNTIITPAQDVTLYARWEERKVDLSDLDIRENKVVFSNTTKLEELKTSLGTDDIILKDSKGNVKTDTSKLGTGDTLIISNETFIISVKGDVTGDGEIKFVDIVSGYGCYKNKQGFTQEQILAIDIDDNDRIGFNDIVSMYGMYKIVR